MTEEKIGTQLLLEITNPNGETFPHSQFLSGADEVTTFLQVLGRATEEGYSYTVKLAEKWSSVSGRIK